MVGWGVRGWGGWGLGCNIYTYSFTSHHSVLNLPLLRINSTYWVGILIGFGIVRAGVVRGGEIYLLSICIDIYFYLSNFNC